jgi:release factor glutamine methyltransferase
MSFGGPPFNLPRWQTASLDTVDIGSHRVKLDAHGDVLSATPYSLFLAENIPLMPGKTVVDLGTGSGVLGIVAKLQGAAVVYVLDINAEAIEIALENAVRNGVGAGFEPLPTGSTVLPLPDGVTVDYIICNPAQLPMRSTEKANDPFFAGEDGRAMIEPLIAEAPTWLADDGRLLMTHNSLSDLLMTEQQMGSVRLEPRVLAERSIEFRPFIDRDWIDELGGTQRGLYKVVDGRAYETLYILEARRRA